MRAKSWIVLIAVALLLVGPSCGGTVCVGYGCVSWGPCYPWCPYAGFRGIGTDFPFFATAATTGDFDADGKLDLLVLDDADGLHHMPGDEADPSDATTVLASSDVAVQRRILPAHLDDDGLLDLVVLGLETGTVEVLLGTGDGLFVPTAGPQVHAFLQDVVDADCTRMDQDALDELVVLHADGRVTVHAADGIGGFAPAAHPVVASEKPITTDAQLVCTELDGLPGTDVAVVLPDAQLLVMLSGRDDGSFERPLVLNAQLPEPLLDATWSTGRDGNPSDLVLLFASEVDEDHRLVRLQLHGENAGLLEEHTTGVKHATRIDAADFTGDGVADLLVIDEASGRIELLETTP